MARELRTFRCGDHKSVQPTGWQSYQLSTITELPSLKLRAGNSIPKVALTLATSKMRPFYFKIRPVTQFQNHETKTAYTEYEG
jgi:hypothetical protein